MHENFLFQMVDRPTREDNILDLILTIIEDIIDYINAGDPFSDHNKVTFKLTCKPYVFRHSRKQVYAYKKADWDHLKCLLQRLNFDCALWNSDINYNWLSWKDLLFVAIDECVPKINA
jgi:hypothetical protein